MTNPPAPHEPSVLPTITMTTTRTPDPPAPPPSLVQRITDLEAELQRIYAELQRIYGMMARDREWMDELRARIGLPV